MKRHIKSANGSLRKTDIAPRPVIKREPTLKRTKGLLNAALDLWAVRNGIKTSPEFSFGYRYTYDPNYNPDERDY